MKHAILALALLAIVPESAEAQKEAAGHGQLVVYNDVTDGPSAVDRDAKKAYAGKFRLIEVKQSDGLTPARLKGFSESFRDPRSMRLAALPCKTVYVFVVTPDGGVIEPRILQSTDQLVSDSAVKSILYRRFVPARFRGVPVFSLQIGNISFGSEGTQEHGLYRDGLGIQGYRDR